MTYFVRSKTLINQSCLQCLTVVAEWHLTYKTWISPTVLFQWDPAQLTLARQKTGSIRNETTGSVLSHHCRYLTPNCNRRKRVNSTVSVTSLNPQESRRQLPVKTKLMKSEKSATEKCNQLPTGNYKNSTVDRDQQLPVLFPVTPTKHRISSTCTDSPNLSTVTINFTDVYFGWPAYSIIFSPFLTLQLSSVDRWSSALWSHHQRSCQFSLAASTTAHQV